VRRVIQPLHALAAHNSAFLAQPSLQPGFARRADEIGRLFRSLERLNHDVTTQLMELRTLLETSNAVVNSLDPRAVGRTIIREVRRLVDVQAAAVLVPDEEGMLRPLVSEGRANNYEEVVRVRPDQLSVPAARALHDRAPVQMINDGNPAFPTFSAAEGFRAVLAIPIISQRVGGVVLVVHRRQPQPFTENEVDLLLTFANYATLAWEHAILYERSDERLREVAHENERLYRQAEAEKQILAAIMGSISDGLLLTSTEGVVLYANPGARALIWQGDTALEGANIASIHAELQAAADRPEQYERDLQRAEAGEIEEWLLETKTGQPRQEQRAIALRLFDVRDEAGERIGRGLLLRDVTRERELDQFKTTLLAAVGHELRTPLAAIKGHASTLLQEDVTWPVDDQRHFLRTISTEADQLAKLVSNLLDLSRLEAGLLALHRVSCRLADLVDAAARGIREEIASLTLDIPAELPPVEVDASRIEVVIHNLLVNARKYGNGAVHLSASARDGVVLVRISDNGPGISPEDVPHIFERFYRSQHARRQQLGGTGLGLAICKAFVEAHGGAIWAESAPTGTTIAFTLPAAGFATGAPALETEAQPVPSGSGQ
jgi:signal transduction histidine kinase